MTDVDLKNRLNDILPVLAAYRLVGLSTTPKPLVAPGGGALADGTIFEEQDTGIRWVWQTSPAQWVSQGFRPGLYDVEHAIKKELAQTRVMLAALRTELRGIRILIGLQVGVAVPSEPDETTVQ